MCCPQMSQENLNPVPTPFRGLRVLLVDNDTASLLNIAKELENSSYGVTTTEIAIVALSILRERKDRFDLIMADTNMPEMDFFNFIKCVQLIKDFPIILMSSELNKDMVKEAMVKGACCFFLKKPISSKNLKNVWQHVFRQSKYENIRTQKAVTESNADQDIESKGDKVEDDEKALEIVRERTLQESESKHVGGSDQIKNDQDDKKLTGIREKRSMSIENDEPGEFKRKKTENEGSERARANSGNSKHGNLNKLKCSAEKEREMEDKGNKFLENQSRFSWTPDVHLKLKGVIDAKGKGETRPGSVLEMMEEPNLTQRQFSSCLQKYRFESLTAELNRATSLSGDRTKILETSSNSNSSYEREFISATPSTHPGVGSMKTHVNKRIISGQSGDFHKQVGRSVEMDGIQAFTRSSHSLSTFLEVTSRKKYHKGVKFL